ncbi:MAG: Cu(I)-responsive transcriptional regulator [Geminicoccaceae bacterium]
MNISEAAEQSGVPPKTIRYYEDIALIDKPLRSENGYRDYNDEDIHILRFVQRARSLGFSVQDCRQLLALYKDPGRASADVKAMAEMRIAEIDKKLAELNSMRTTLAHLAVNCHGDDKPACPILDDLAAAGDGRA